MPKARPREMIKVIQSVSCAARHFSGTGAAFMSITLDIVLSFRLVIVIDDCVTTSDSIVEQINRVALQAYVGQPPVPFNS